IDNNGQILASELFNSMCHTMGILIFIMIIIGYHYICPFFIKFNFGGDSIAVDLPINDIYLPLQFSRALIIRILDNRLCYNFRLNSLLLILMLGGELCFLFLLLFIPAIIAH